MAWNMVVAASGTADIFTLGNDIFTEILTALFMMAVIVCAVILGGKLRGKHDAKVAAEAAVAAETADIDDKTEQSRS